MKENNKVFYSSLILTLIILSLMIYVSSIQPSKEDFVEVYWQVFKVENFTSTSNIVCKIMNCTTSGIYKLSKINLDGSSFNIIEIDLTNPGDYYSLCIDFNNDNQYCDRGEGPFGYRDTFLFNSYAFNIYNLGSKIIIVNYPKEVKNQTFTVGFVIKSYYSEIMDFNLGLYVNETLQKNKNLTINPRQEVVSYFNVSLPTEGISRVKVVVSPSMTNEEAYIDFVVKKVE